MNASRDPPESIRAGSDAAPGTDSEAAWKETTLARIDSLRMETRAPAALAEIAGALPRARGDSSLTLQLKIREGELQTSLGHARRGEEVLREALSLARSQRDTASVSAALRWLGVAVGALGRTHEAADLFHELLSFARKRGDLMHEGWAMVGLAWVAEVRGQGAEAADLYRRAAGIFRDVNDPRSEAWARNGLGTALSRIGEYDEARTSFRSAAVLAQETGYIMVEAFAANNLGTLEYSLGDPGSAAGWFRRAAASHRALGEVGLAVIPAINIALCDADLGQLELAADSLEALRTHCRGLGLADQEARVVSHLAAVRDRQGRRSEADRLWRAILAAHPAALLRSRTEAGIGLARSLAARDSIQAAVALLENVLREIPEPVDPPARIEARTALAGMLLDMENAAHGGGHSTKDRRTAGEAGPVSARRPPAARLPQALELARGAAREAARHGLSGLGSSALVQEARIWRALGWPDSARVTLERAAAVWEAERGTPLDPRWREQRTAAGHEICVALASALLEPEAGGTRTERVRRAYARAQAFKARTLLERMTGPSEMKPPRLGAVTRDFGSPGAFVERLQTELLAEGEVLLDFFLGPETSLLFVVTRDSCRAVGLPSREEIESAVRLYFGLVAEPPNPASVGDRTPLDGTRAVGGSLRAKLLGEADDLIGGGRRILVAPDGIVNLVPFAHLEICGDTRDPVGGGTVAQDSGEATREWVRVPSVNVLAAIREKEKARNGRRLHPDPRQAEAPAAAGRTESGSIRVFAPRSGDLPGARREVETLARTYRTVTLRLVSEEETLRVDELGAGPEVLHLAGHAEVNDERPWRSSISLGADEIRADEIAGRPVSTRLAVLAGCRTAQGRVLNGEGVLGLSTAFLSSGTSCVVAALWPLADDAAERLVTCFYQELAGGATVARALGRAQEMVRQEPRTAHPFFWAGVVAIGAGETQIPLERASGPTWLHWTILGPAALLVLSGFWVVILRRRRRLMG